MARATRAVDAAAVAETERWFVRRGLPHFIFHYSASQDVWTRAIPVLTAVYVAEVAVNAPSSDYSVAESFGAVVAGLAMLIGIWVVVNSLRRRPPFSRPDHMGPFEVLVFVVAPPLVPLIFGFQWRSAAVTAGVNVGLLTVIYLATSYGLVPMTRWVAEHGARQLLSVVGVLVRALPLLLLVVIVVFVNTEAWQVASDLRWPALAIVVGLFFVLGTLFAVIRVPRQVGELVQEPWDVVRARVDGTPAQDLRAFMPARPPDPPELSKKEWGNVGLVVLASEGVLVALVVAFMFVFFVVFGLLAISPGVVHSWLGHTPDVLVTFHLFDQRMVLTEELLKVSAFLAGFSGLYFTVAMLSDATYQQEFLAKLVGEVREALAVRAVYLTVMIRRAQADPAR